MFLILSHTRTHTHTHTHTHNLSVVPQDWACGNDSVLCNYRLCALLVRSDRDTEKQGRAERKGWIETERERERERERPVLADSLSN